MATETPDPSKNPAMAHIAVPQKSMDEGDEIVLT